MYIFDKGNNMKKINLFILTLFLASCDAGIGTGFLSKLIPTLLFKTNSISTQVGTGVTLTWVSENANSCSASGAWSGTKGPSGSENIVINMAGQNEFLLTCTGTSNKTAFSSLVVNGQKIFTGRVIDGYIRGAKVYIDQNNNFSNDENEPSTFTDNEGLFQLQYEHGTLISEGGVDIITGNQIDKLALSLPLYGYTEYKTVTPLTSLLTFFENRINLNLALGIDNSIDLSNTDPEAMKNDAPIYSYLYEKGNQVAILALGLQVFVDEQSGDNKKSEGAFNSIASILEEKYLSLNQQVNIESSDFIEKVVDHFINLSITENINFIKPTENSVANLKNILSSTLPVIELKSNEDITTAVFNFSTSVLMDDIRKAASNRFDSSLINAYEKGVTSYIASSQNLDEMDLSPNTELNFDNLSIVSPNGTLVTDNETSISNTAVFINNYNLVTNDSSLPITLSNIANNNGQFTADIIVNPSFYSFERLSALEVNFNSSEGIVLNPESVKLDIFGHAFNNNKGNHNFSLVWISPVALNTLENKKIGTLNFQLNSINQNNIDLIVESTLIGGERNSINSKESGIDKTTYTLISNQTEINI